MQLRQGDKVSTGEGGGAEIMLQDGTWLQVGANSGMVIKTRPGQPATSPEKEKNFEVVQNFIKLKDAEGTSALTGLRGGDDDELVGVSPGRTRIRTDRPTFAWKIADPSTELQLTVYGGSGVHWQTDVKGTTSFAYPADAPALAPGTKYSWTVETTDPLVFPPLRSQPVFFEVISPEEAEKLDEALAAIDADEKPSASTVHLMRASLFFDQGLIEDAINETLTALETDPDNGTLHAILAKLYAESGRNDEAIKAYEKLVNTN
jgi:tetratricopeptide (TPR) repeat protein